MRSFLCGATALACVAAVPAQLWAAEKEPVLAWHFAGIPSLKNSNPGAVLIDILGLKQSSLLGRQIQNQVCAQLPALFDVDARKLSTDILAPIVGDLVNHESALRVDGDNLTGGDWVLAIARDKDNSDLWSATFLALGRKLGFGEPEKFSFAGLDGWRIPPSSSMRAYSLLVQQDWVLVASRIEDGTTAGKWAQALAQNGRPVAAGGDNWLSLSVNLPALNWPSLLPFAGQVNQVDASFSWQKTAVRTSATITLAADRPAVDDAWRIPRGIIHDPLVSFTAAKGLKPFLSGLGAFKGLQPDLVPNQWLGWTLGSVVFVDDFAMPEGDAAKAFEALKVSVPRAYDPDIAEMSLGKWMVATNQPRLLWRGLPVFVPYFGPTNDHGQGFLYGGIFPLTPTTNEPPAPAELFSQFESNKDVVYYDWEVTPARLAAYDQMRPFAELFLPPAKPAPATYAAAWLADSQRKLGNVITEISGTGPRQLTLTRKSQLGMTGIELWLFTHWLDSSTFPKFPYSRPHRPESGKKPGMMPVPSTPPKH